MTRVSITRKINVRDPNVLPAWVPEPGTIAAISLNTVNDVRPLDWTTPLGDLEGVFQSWGGGVYAPELGALGSLLVGGTGGHNNYDGNEVYRYDIDTRLWSRIGEPTHVMVDATLYANTLGEIKAEYGGGVGVKAALHTYAGQFYVKPSLAGNTNGYFCTAPHTPTQICHKYDLDAVGVNGWSRVSDSASAVSGNGMYPSACWDSVRERVWFFTIGSYRLHYMPWSTKEWVATNAWSNSRGTTTPFDYCPLHDLLVQYQNYLGDEYLGVVDPDNPTSWIAIPYTGTGPTKSDGTTRYAAMTWCDDLNCFLLYMGEGSKTVYKLTPPATNPLTNAWVFSSETLTGTTPPWTMNGPLTKFRYVPAIRCAVYADGKNQSVVAFRMTGT